MKYVLYTNFTSSSRKMIPKEKPVLAKVQQTNRCVFGEYYNDLCQWSACVSSHLITAHLSQNCLDFFGDRIKLDEWKPIVKALSSDRSLRLIAVRCSTSSSIAESANTVLKARNCATRPPILTGYVMKMFIKSLTDCLSNNRVLTCLEIEGLFLSLEYIEDLATAIGKSDSLRQISFHRSLISDEGLELVCRSIKRKPRIVSLDISGCGITGIGAQSLNRIIKYQKILMSRDAWQHSLRAQDGDENIISGLERITLNHNPMFGDAGAMALVEELEDHFWFKAIDLQDCGLTDVAGKAALKMVQLNSSLEVVDVRSNKAISPVAVRQIMQQLQTNDEQRPKQVRQHDWLSVEKNLSCTWRPVTPKKTICCFKARRLKSTIGGTSVPIAFGEPGPPGYAKPRPGPRISGKYATSGIARTEQYKLVKAPYLASTPVRSFVQKTKDEEKEEVECLNQQLEAVTSSMVTILQSLNDEKKKREEAEQELLSIRRQQEGSIVLSHETVEDIEEAFDSFAKFLQAVRESGLVPRIVETMEKQDKILRDVEMSEVEIKQRMQMLLLEQDSQTQNGETLTNKHQQFEVQYTIKTSDTPQNVVTKQPKLDVKTSYSNSGQQLMYKHHDVTQSRPASASSIESRASCIFQAKSLRANNNKILSKNGNNFPKNDNESGEGLDYYGGGGDHLESLRRTE